MTELTPVIVLDTLGQLNDRLQRAYKMHMDAKEPALSPTVQTRLFELYLNGCSLEEIHRANKGYKMGWIVRAWLEGEWEQKRAEYVNHLLQTVIGRVEQVQSESIKFVSDLLAVAHKQHGDRLRSYLQSGDSKEIEGALSITSLASYGKVADMLLKLTGQMKDLTPHTQVPQAIGPMVKTVEASKVIEMKSLPESPTTEEATSFLEAMYAEVPEEK